VGLIGSSCAVAADCDTGLGSNDGVCGNYDPIANDGVRGGTCFKGRNPDLSCDIDAPNTSFPAPGGGGQSLDCFPKVGLNVSGAGLKIDIIQTTDLQSVTAAVPCGSPPDTPRICPCGLCSTEITTTCRSNADCPGGGTCEALGTSAAFPNSCAGGNCSDTGDGIEGECTTGPDIPSCDGIVRANGNGFIQCTNNSECALESIGSDAGACTLLKRLDCFLDPLNSQGVAHPTSPIGAAIFCIAKTSNSGINSTAGLPGPGRVTNQGSSRTFCASNHAVQYQPGVGGCP
jgi:hypothetical protein